MIYIACGALLLIAYLVYLQVTESTKRRERTALLRVLLIEIEQAEVAFRSALSPEAGYFAHYTLRTWTDRYYAVIAKVEGSQFE